MLRNGERVYEYLLQQFPQLHDGFIFVTANPAKKEQMEHLTNAVPCARHSARSLFHGWAHNTYFLFSCFRLLV